MAANGNRNVTRDPNPLLLQAQSVKEIAEEFAKNPHVGFANDAVNSTRAEKEKLIGEAYLRILEIAEEATYVCNCTCRFQPPNHILTPLR
jgi:hypothetical protein